VYQPENPNLIGVSLTAKKTAATGHGAGPKVDGPGLPPLASESEQAAKDDRGRDVSAILKNRDAKVVEGFELDRRFVGFAKDHFVELEFDQDIDGEAMIVADAWKMMPFVLFLMFAAILSIEPEQYEAARLDGANAWQEFRYLTFPMILPVVAVTAAFRAVDAFTKIFDTVFVTTGGGPATDTQVFPLLIWRTTFDYLNFGHASALAVVAIIVSALLGASLLAIRRASST